MKPGWAKKGLTKKAADAALPKPMKINDLKKGEWECKKCGNRTERWKSGACAPCARRRQTEKYARLKLDPERYQQFLADSKFRAEQKRQEESNIQNYMEERNKTSRKEYHTRKFRIKQATPDWLIPEQVVEIESKYFQARTLERKTGQKYHVDHIIPLKHPLVCGLHVPWNLRVITAEENNKRKNEPYRDPNEIE